MNKLFAPFLPPWAETGLQPAFYDMESGTVLQQTARMYDKVNQLIRLFNQLSEETKTIVEEYIAKFVELKDFVDDYFDNLDVQEEINNKLDAMAENGTLQRIMGDYVGIANVKMCGAVGDGITDDTSAIQQCINDYPNTTVHFPAGTYLISAPIEVSSTDSKKVYLHLDKNTIIKASNDFVGDYLIVLGKAGVKEDMLNSIHQIGIEGGILDCNGKCSGIYNGNTHYSKIANLSIQNATLEGIRVDKSSNNSGDCYITNVDITAYDGTEENAIGLHITSTDNNFNNIRTAKFITGIYAENPANYFEDCHPLYGNADRSIYEKSIGFKLKAAEHSLVNCYSDNFSTAIQTDGSRFYAYNFFAYWYETSNFKHTIIECSTEYFRGNIDGLTINFPYQSTENYGIRVTANNHYFPVYGTTLNGNLQSGCIKNVYLADNMWSRLKDKFTDPIITSNVLNEQTLYQGGYDDTIEADKYYPVMYIPTSTSSSFTSEITKAKIKFSNVFDVDIRFQIISDALRVYGVDTKLNSSGFGFTFALAKPSFAGNCYILYIKFDKTPTDNNKIFETHLVEPSYNNRMTIVPRGAKYLIEELNGVTTPDGLLTTYDTITNQNAYTGIIEHQTNWATKHEFLLKNPVTSNSNPILFFIIFGSSVGVYSFFANKFMPLNTDNIHSGDTCTASYNGTTGKLTITTSQTAMIYSIKL